MASLTAYRGLQVVTPDPTGDGGLAIQDDLKSLVDWSPKSVWAQSADPTVDDDETEDFFPGSLWLRTDTTPPKLFVCQDSSTGAAVWQLILLQVVQDDAPKLGGDLDVNGQKIVSSSNGDIVVEPDGTGGTLNERLYALQDANWNVTSVADSTGTVQERYEYDPYGATTVLSPTFAVRATSNFGWETTYCGYRWDAGTGLFAVRNRFYHPRLGVWLTRDPLTTFTSWPNLFQYVDSSPLRLTDPTGLGFWSSFGRGLVAGLATAAVVVAGAALFSTVGVPAAVITGGLFVIGAVGTGLAVGSIISNPTPDNIGYTAGAFTGGAIVGGFARRPLATRLSPKGNQPAPGWAGWSPKRDASQCWRFNVRENPCTQVGNMMSTGPNPLSGAGAVTAAGGGIPSSAHNLSE